MKASIFILLLSLLFSCSSQQKVKEQSSEKTTNTQALAPQIIYKTKKDFTQNVPIQMNKDKTKIVGFPAPSDLSVNGELQTPIKLKQGYFYDRRGVSSNTVFLEMTYNAYSKLGKVPSIKELQDMIIEKHPFIEVYSCPSLKSGSSVNSMNELVKSGFEGCKKIK